MKKRLSILLCAALLLVASVGAAETGGSEGVLYRASYQGNTVYLLGSIHIGTADMYPVSDAMQAAIDAADVFAFECDTESAEAYRCTLLATTYSDGSKLSEHISPEAYALVRLSAEKLGLSADSLNSFRPWAVMSTFSTYLTAEVMGESDIAAAQQYGVETYVRGCVGDRETRYLETVESQIAAMESFSPELQEYLVASTCESYLDPAALTGTDADMRFWPEWWHNGRIDRFADSYLSGYLVPGYEALCEEYNEKLILQRNVTMADGVEAMLTEGGGRAYFVTVGLLHLVPSAYSVPALLTRRGYEVEVVSAVIE